MPLSSKQRSQLRSWGQKLKPVLIIGKGGITDPVLEKLKALLEQHELIKVKFLSSAGADRDEGVQTLAEGARCDVAGRAGSTALLFRQSRDNPRIQLQDD